MIKKNNKEFKKWTQKNSYEKSYGPNNPPSYPNETVVRVCLSKRFTRFNIDIFKKKFQLLEVGCFSGNNLRFFLENKVKCFGSEINDEMKNLCSSNLKRLRLNPPTIKLGNNENINYEGNRFNLLISINTIHYSYADNLEKAVREYSRVLKKGGIAIIESPTKDHNTVRTSKKIADFHFLWGPSGFRKKSPMGFINNLPKFKKILKKYFSDFELNYKTEYYEKIKLSTYVFVCKK